MKAGSIFGLVAIMPLALAVSPAAAGSLRLPLCDGAVTGRTVEIPVPGKTPRGGDDPCCVKGCHAGCSRKRIVRDFDTPQ